MCKNHLIHFCNTLLFPGCFVNFVLEAFRSQLMNMLFRQRLWWPTATFSQVVRGSGVSFSHQQLQKTKWRELLFILLLTEIIRDGGGVQLSKVILNNNAEQRPWLLQEGTKPVEVDFETHIKCISEQHITFVVTFRQFALVIARTDWPGAMGIFFLRDVLSKSWPCTIWSVRSP